MNLLEQFKLVKDHWSPRIIGAVNDQYIKIAKLKGSFVWHDHKEEDEMFYVVKGSMRIEFESETIQLNAGEFYVVPKGKKHNPVADDECWIMLIEPKSTKHTGDVSHPSAISIEEQLRSK